MTAELNDSERNSILASFAGRMKKCHRNLEKAEGGDRISQEELGRRVGRGGGSVSEWERGETIPDVFTLAALARLFNRSLAWMVSGEVAAISAADVMEAGDRTHGGAEGEG